MTTETPAIVSSTTCVSLKNTTKPFILALKMGENLFESLIKAATAMNITAASISGLGALDDVTVAYYNLNTKQYQTKLYKGMYELVSLNGNIALVDNKPFIHIHAALGTEEYHLVGGHIMDATVGPSAEITVIPLGSAIHRAYDHETGLKLMCPIQPSL